MSDARYMASRHDLDDYFWSIRDHFGDKETEGNWLKREEAMKALRKITMGNSPTEFKDAYLAGIKMILEGIVKAINSLVSPQPLWSMRALPSFNHFLQPVEIFIISSRFLSPCRYYHSPPMPSIDRALRPCVFYLLILSQFLSSCTQPSFLESSC